VAGLSEKATRLEHPLPAVLMHWAHLLSFFVLIFTGLEIHAHTTVVGTFEMTRQVHFIVMEIFIATAVIRIYWAFFGRGSASLGSLKRTRDYKFFAMHKQDWKDLGPWLKYYLFMRKTKPYTEKYNPLQKLSYLVLFPLFIVLMALTGFALWEPTQEAFSWVANILGGLNGARLWHYEIMWVFIALFMVHLYLVFMEDIVQAPIMLWRSVPKKSRVAGDYPSASGSGKA
jgi:Ni/Fe-hydrogenase 1 B-type cytochrome subunit